MVVVICGVLEYIIEVNVVEVVVGKVVGFDEVM